MGEPESLSGYTVDKQGYYDDEGFIKLFGFMTPAELQARARRRLADIPSEGPNEVLTYRERELYARGLLHGDYPSAIRDEFNIPIPGKLAAAGTRPLPPKVTPSTAPSPSTTAAPMQPPAQPAQGTGSRGQSAAEIAAALTNLQLIEAINRAGGPLGSADGQYNKAGFANNPDLPYALTAEVLRRVDAGTLDIAGGKIVIVSDAERITLGGSTQVVLGLGQLRKFGIFNPDYRNLTNPLAERVPYTPRPNDGLNYLDTPATPPSGNYPPGAVVPLPPKFNPEPPANNKGNTPRPPGLPDAKFGANPADP